MEKAQTQSGEHLAQQWQDVERLLRERLAALEKEVGGEAEPLQRLMHELRVHQAELEAQNEELARAQSELEDTRNRYADLFESAPLAYYTLDGDGRIVDVNRSGAALLGVERDRLLGQLLQRFVAPENHDPYLAHHRAVLATRTHQQVTLAMTRNDGESFFAHVSCLAMAPPGGGPLLVRTMIEDITRLVQTEQALRHSEERYRTLVQNIPDVLWSMDSSYHFTYVGPRAEELTGFTSASLTGAPLETWVRRIHPDDQAWVMADLKALIEQGVENDMEFRFQRRDGEWIWLRGHAVRSTDEHGQVRADGLLSDITEQRQAREQVEHFSEEVERQLEDERRRVERLERRRADMEKLAATGRLAAAVAHEINNPLAGIKNSFQLIKRAVSPEHPHYGFLALIDKELARVTEIVRQMYLLYQPSVRLSLECDAPVALGEVLYILDATLRAARLTVKNRSEPQLPRIKLADGEFKQVAYNLIRNAIQASPEGGVLELDLARCEDVVCLQVRDFGAGIAEDALPHIFEPFFSTHHDMESGGMGLGLSVTRSLVENAGGHIHVATEVGKGTTFIVTLPAVLTESGSLMT